MNDAQFDVVVVGGGAVGLSAALHLARRSFRVALIEREALPGSHASGKNAGMIRQLYRHPQLTDWAARSIIAWPPSLRTHFVETGSLVVGRESPGHHDELFDERPVQTARGLEPAVYTRSDGLLDSPSYVNALAGECRSLGVKLLFGASPLSVELDRHGCIIRTDREIARAELCINAAGAWADDLLPNLSLGLQAYARHLFLIGGFPKGYMPARDCGFYWDEPGSWYMRKWSDELRLVSLCDKAPATPESYSGTPPQDALATALLHELPNVARSLDVRTSWHCFRTYADDQLPVIGFDPRVPSLFWLAGFGGFGMSTSFAAGEDAARLISREIGSVSVDLSPERLISGSELRCINR